MPAGREQVANTPLSGAEVRELILADARRLVENHGLLANHIAYGRIGYELILRLHLENAVFSDTSAAGQSLNNTSMKSRPIATNIISHDPALAAIDTPPLAGADDSTSVVLAERVSRHVDSPNRERLREGMPIPTTVRGQDGGTRVEMVKRSADADLGPGDVRFDDDTEEARSAWNLPAEDIVRERAEDAADAVMDADSNRPLVSPVSGPAPHEDSESAKRRKVDEFFGEGTYDARKAEERGAGDPA